MATVENFLVDGGYGFRDLDEPEGRDDKDVALDNLTTVKDKSYSAPPFVSTDVMIEASIDEPNSTLKLALYKNSINSVFPWWANL